MIQNQKPFLKISFTSESDETAHLVLVLVDAVSAAVHLADEYLHGDVAGARILESVLEPPPRAVRHHLCERHPLILLEPARRRQIPHLGPPRAGRRRSGGGGGVPGGIQRGLRRLHCLPGGSGGRRGAEAAGVRADRGGGGDGGGREALAHAKVFLCEEWRRTWEDYEGLLCENEVSPIQPPLPKVEKLVAWEGRAGIR